jgi:hypothetical protein
MYLVCNDVAGFPFGSSIRIVPLARTEENHMAIEPAYQVDRNPDEIVLRLRRNEVNEARISRFLSYLELASIRDRSRLSAEAAAELADEVDQAVWKKNRARLSGHGP